MKHSWRNRLLYYQAFLPITWLAFFFAGVFYAAYKLLQQPEVEKLGAGIYPLLGIMAKLSMYFLLAIISLSILSTLVSWLYVLLLFKRKKYTLQLDIQEQFQQGTTKKQLQVVATLPRALRPLLGMIHIRLVLQDITLVEPFSLYSHKGLWASFWPSNMTGSGQLVLPHIKQYELTGFVLQFQDMLRLFSLPIFQNFPSTFYNPPSDEPVDALSISPRKTDENLVRINELRPVEGEWTTYKDFEPGDDVRRILWKVYAKRKELVVRMPERLEPYASILEVLPSFHLGLDDTHTDNPYLQEMLSYYKQQIWVVYKRLHQQDWQINLLSDQQVTTTDQHDKSLKAKRSISLSDWQQHSTLMNFMPLHKNALVVISSLNAATDVEQMLTVLPPNAPVIFIPLSNLFKQPLALSLLEKIFFQAPADTLGRLRRNWGQSKLRRSLQQNEQKLQRALQNHGKI